MKHKIIFFSLLFLMLVGLFALNYFLSSNRNNYNLYLKQCQEYGSSELNEILALKYKQVSYCKNNVFCQAIVLGDASLCNGLEEKNECEAIITKNPSLCFKDDVWCISRAKNDVKECDKFSSKEASDKCKSIILLNTSYFDKELEKCSDFVFSRLAFEKKDKSFCDRIEDVDVQKNCLSYFA